MYTIISIAFLVYVNYLIAVWADMKGYPALAVLFFIGGFVFSPLFTGIVVATLKDLGDD